MIQATSLKNPQDSHQTGVIVVGAGPIGLELGVALRRAGVDFQIIDAGSVGHTMSWWAPQTRWFSSNERIAIAGVPLTTEDQTKATRETYLNYLRGICTQFDLPIKTHSRVVGVRGQRGEFVLDVDINHTEGSNHISTTQQWCCEKIVLAIGGTDFPNRLNIPGSDLPHVDGYLREPHRYFGRRVLVIGGRNSAIEAALRLHHAGAHVSLSYRGETLPEQSIKYWMLPEIKGLLASGRIVDLVGSVPTQINAESVQLRRLADDQLLEVPADDVLSLIGYGQDKRLFRGAGVELTGEMQRPVFDENTMETNVPGIYVAGTAVAGTQSSKYKTFLENCHVHVGRIVDHMGLHQAGDFVQLRAANSPAYESMAKEQPES